MKYDSAPPPTEPGEHASEIVEAFAQDPIDAAREAIDRFNVAGPERHQTCRLQRRFDTKFVIPPDELSEFLCFMLPDYRIALAGESRAASYTTSYFDTSCLTFFNQHLRGRRPRFKVRIRHHLERELSFFEIKRKNPGGSTSKFRAPIKHGRATLTPSEVDKACQYTSVSDPLSCALEVTCHRILLFHRTREERVTIDYNMQMSSRSQDTQTSALVLEVKQPRIDRTSPALSWCRKRKHHVTSLSKYCYGVAGLHPAGNPRYYRTLPKQTQLLMGGR